ncbi:hydrolase 76 protein [Boothiomyces macroporosus]|uniref:mannan endo-1,6-alpha-mannosidase n=1 Tax=Boothiomyces macroporosus TaxID=261099 RepID=A0AAD5UBY4_9FUNG|nr:hydrolase 76 protein [Boothiomyces macroporosus]
MVILINKASVLAFTKEVTANLMSYYISGQTASGLKWYQGGIMWNAVLEYSKTTGDHQYDTTIYNALLASSTLNTVWQGKDVVSGQIVRKYNDDVLWVAIATAEAALKAHNNPKVASDLTITAQKYYELVWKDWNTVCRGGIWWYRDQGDNRESAYKSAIANSQQIYLGAQLYKITNSNSYLNNNYSILKWMQYIKLVTPDHHVYDGVLTKQNCAVYYQKELSYQVGELIGALSYSYMYSQDKAFLTLAEKLFLKSTTIFMHKGGAMLEYVKVSGDNSYIDKISNAIQLAGAGTTGSFLGVSSTVSETIGGRWNDDILWWAIACATGGEIYGGNTVIPGGVSFQALTQTTYDQAWGQWDPTCSGGIWWSRDRSNIKYAGYKSSITNTEEMLVGAKLAIATGQSKYIDNGNQIYSWMNQTGLFTSDFRVLDGIHCDKNCTINSNELSYQSGMLIGALTFTYAFTQDQSYLLAANNVAKASFQTFLTNSSVIVDTNCEPNCPVNQVSPKGVYIRMLGYLYEYTNDASVQSTIKTALQSSFAAMLNICDSNYNCANNWQAGSGQNYSVHSQINALELTVAYSKTFLSVPVQAPQGLTLTQSSPSYFGMSRAAFTMIVCATAAATFALISVILKTIVRKFTHDNQKS